MREILVRRSPHPRSWPGRCGAMSCWPATAEEFAVVLPETGVEPATMFCERIRSEVESASFDFDGEPLRATIILGAAEIRPSDSLESLVARAIDGTVVQGPADPELRPSDCTSLFLAAVRLRDAGAVQTYTP